MNLLNEDTQQAILDIAAASECPQVVDFCRVVIRDLIEHEEYEVEDANEVISLAVEVVGARDVQGLNRQSETPLIASLIADASPRRR
jgi:hypothetical protein